MQNVSLIAMAEADLSRRLAYGAVVEADLWWRLASAVLSAFEVINLFRKLLLWGCLN
jgi:hypothetical protein